jgi:hypothetical protein
MPDPDLSLAAQFASPRRQFKITVSSTLAPVDVPLPFASSFW